LFATMRRIVRPARTPRDAGSNTDASGCPQPRERAHARAPVGDHIDR
jgi:hypothetical protein